MRSINGYFLFELGKVWQLLDLRVGEPARSCLDALEYIIAYLQGFVADERNQLDLADSTKAATVLIEHLKKLTAQADAPVTEQYKNTLLHILTAFNDRLFNELGKVHVWVLEEKRAYSINALWRFPLRLIATDAVPHLSDFVIENVSEAAKCLLLDRYTAVGFHAMRSVECVARKYYELITNNLPPYHDKNGKEYFRTLGVIAAELKEAHAALKTAGQASGHLEIIAGSLISLNNLYRKTLAHIDIEKLTEDQATNALIQATDVIGTMVLDAKTGGEQFQKAWTANEKF